MIEPPRLNCPFFLWQYHGHTDNLHSTFSFPSSKSKKPLLLPKTHFFMPCFHEIKRPSSRDAGSSKMSVQKPVLIQWERDIPKLKTIWNEDGKFIRNSWAALRPFPESKHIGITTKCVCEEEKQTVKLFSTETSSMETGSSLISPLKMDSTSST